MSSKQHWEQVYTRKAADAVSWYQPHALRSLELIRRALPDTDTGIVDVGGGASTLVDDLLQAGYARISVLDLSGHALALSRERLGAQAARVSWYEGDVTRLNLPPASADLWHDRAVFHFLVEDADRRAYVEQARRTLKPGGLLVVATFADDGPQQCSGLPVQRYSATTLAAEFSPCFQLLHTEDEDHLTPAGNRQHFVYCLLRRID